MKHVAIKIKYINSCGKTEVGYTVADEIENARQGITSFVWVTDDIADIKDGRVMMGYTVDYLDITKIFK